MTIRYALREDQRERLREALPGQDGDAGRVVADNRKCIEAVR